MRCANITFFTNFSRNRFKWNAPIVAFFHPTSFLENRRNISIIYNTQRPKDNSYLYRYRAKYSLKLFSFLILLQFFLIVVYLIECIFNYLSRRLMCHVRNITKNLKRCSLFRENLGQLHPLEFIFTIQK